MEFGNRMESTEFFNIRKYMGKTQDQLSHLLCISVRTVKSYEQGWRKIPVNVERYLLYLFSLVRSKDENTKPCWELLNCPTEWRDNCNAWEVKSGYSCWFINGTFCGGKEQNDWYDKLELCRQCEVFQPILATPEANIL